LGGIKKIGSGEGEKSQGSDSVLLTGESVSRKKKNKLEEEESTRGHTKSVLRAIKILVKSLFVVRAKKREKADVGGGLKVLGCLSDFKTVLEGKGERF